MAIVDTTATSPARIKTQSRDRVTQRSHRWIEPLDILVLAGGPGVEREVSLQSGTAVHNALARLGHRPILRDISPADLAVLEIPVDFVFIALHGEFGEDGAVQAELDRRGIRYSGCDADASQTAMDKVKTKRLAIEAGVKTPAFEVASRDTVDGIAHRFGAPAVVKPVDSGSSVDITIARSSNVLQNAAQQVVTKYGHALVERFVAGPELTVGILGDEALPVCEIRTQREFYDYDAKYLDDDTEYLFDLDPNLSDDAVTRVQEQSLTVHRALGCRVLSRVDWIVDENTGEPNLLEVNTIPGFTSHSLVPKAAARVGIDFDQLCQRVVELSLASF